MRRKRGADALSTAGPFLLFMMGGWYGIMSLVQSKRDMRAATKGLDAVEESDPLQRMRAAYGLDATTEQKETVRVSSLDEELATMKSKICIQDFDYKPVPRPAEDD